jgi:hypothetical protein
VRDAIATYSRIKRLPRHQEQGPQESSWPGSGVAQGREESFEFRVAALRSSSDGIHLVGSTAYMLALLLMKL